MIYQTALTHFWLGFLINFGLSKRKAKNNNILHRPNRFHPQQNLEKGHPDDPAHPVDIQIQSNELHQKVKKGIENLV